jgi:hypothetical protein
VQFLTDAADALQVGLFERPQGYCVAPHTHPPKERTVTGTPEFLYVEEGEIAVVVFDEAWRELGTDTLSAGDFLLFLRGGHSVTMRAPTRLLEVKQGPFPGDGEAKTYRASS